MNTVVICPIRYDGGARPEDHQLWVELRRLFSDSQAHLLGFISVTTGSHWVDQFNPVPPAARHQPRLQAVELPSGA